MKTSAHKISLLVSAFAVFGLFTAPMAHATNEGIAAKAKKMEEHEARRQLSALKKYDVNGNGVLDPEEEAAKKSDAKAKRDATVLKKYDANGNGVLDPDELAKQQADTTAKHDAAVLKKYDKNGNGVLDPDEAAAFKANQDKMQALRDAKNKKTSAKATAAVTSASTPQQ